MTIADLCIFIAALLPIGAVSYAKMSARKRFDNATPRDPGTYTGEALRAYNAHLNSFEAFPFFAVAVLFAEWHAAAQGCIDLLAVAFIVLRVAYIIAYVRDRSTLRSAIYTLAFLATAAIFFLPMLAAWNSFVIPV